jgi:transcriptional regulator with XRE-family HTH domain
MSQLELEAAIDSSAGAISRIENNQVNPTKETILNIAKILNLNNIEIDYLIGQTALPAREREIDSAKEESSEILNQRGRLAYLLDDRWRFYSISATFIKLLKMSQSEIDYVIGRTTAQIIVEEESPVMHWVDKEHYLELLNTYLPTYYSAMSHMDDDPIFQNSVKAIKKNKLAKEIWNGLSMSDRRYSPQENRVIHFKMFGIKFPLYYSWQELVVNRRFYVVEYYTENKFLNLLPKLI